MGAESFDNQLFVEVISDFAGPASCGSGLGDTRELGDFGAIEPRGGTQIQWFVAELWHYVFEHLLQQKLKIMKIKNIEPT